jgi:hypothetical protein
MMLSLLILSCIAVCFVNGQDGNGAADAVADDFIEEESMDGEQQPADAQAQEDMRPDPIDWSVEPEGPPVEFFVLVR